MKIKTIIIGLLLIISSCSQRWCLNKYPPDTTRDSTFTTFEEQVPVISPGGHFTIPVFVDCDTITDTITIYEEFYLPPDTQWITTVDTVWMVKEGKVVTVKEKNPINKVLLGVVIGLIAMILITIFLAFKILPRGKTP